MAEKENVPNIQEAQSKHSTRNEERSRLALLVCVPTLTLLLFATLIIVLVLKH